LTWIIRTGSDLLYPLDLRTVISGLRISVLDLASIDVARIVGTRDSLRQWFISLVLQYRLIETHSRQDIEKLQCTIPGDG
jgi:hypothetical protein